MLKTEIVENTFPGRGLRITGELPAAESAERFDEYREDARKMLSKLARDFNALGVKQVLAAALDTLSTREGEDWLRTECGKPRRRRR